MNKPSKITFRLAAAAQILAIILLASCTPGSKLTVCHATGDTANPYQELTVSTAQLAEHVGHPNDIIPAPANGCPTVPVVPSEGKITICHATGIEATPYNEISVSVNGLEGHGTHAGDIIPAPEAGCPTTTLAVGSDGKITICHATGSAKNPYNLITVDINGLNGHDKHAGDIIPAPAAGCPTTKP